VRTSVLRVGHTEDIVKRKYLVVGLGCLVCGVVVLGMLAALLGGRSVVRTVVVNASSRPLSNIRVQLPAALGGIPNQPAATIQPIGMLKPGQHATVEFALPAMDASFAVEAYTPSGARVQRTVGYVFQITTQAVIVFVDSGEDAGVDVLAFID